MLASDVLARHPAQDFARGLVIGALRAASFAGEARSPIVRAEPAVFSPLDAEWCVQDLLWRAHARRALAVLPAIGSHTVWLPRGHSFGAVDEHQALLYPATDAWFDGTLGATLARSVVGDTSQFSPRTIRAIVDGVAGTGATVKLVEAYP